MGPVTLKNQLCKKHQNVLSLGEIKWAQNCHGKFEWTRPFGTLGVGMRITLKYVFENGLEEVIWAHWFRIGARGEFFKHANEFCFHKNGVLLNYVNYC
jgi:hypothetical protein